MKNYNLNLFKFDFKAGLAVAAVSLPVGVAYSEMLGLPPESGIFTAVFSLICYFFIGTSKDLIIGPDSAITALLASTIFTLNIADANIKIDFIILTTIVTGIFFFIAGFLKLGFIANFLSRPILVGFLNGVAVILIISQLQKFTGVEIQNSNSIIGIFEFISKISSVHFPTLVIGIISLFMIGILGKISIRIPSQIMLIVISIICVIVFQLNQYQIKFSPEIISSIPLPSIPDFSLLKTHYSTITIDAFAILFLSYTNTVLVGRSFSSNKREYNPDKEFFAMGLADTVCGIFRGFPICGSTSRTIINISSGAKTKYAQLFAALVMILVVLFLSKEFALIPSVVFAAIIIDAAIGMFNFRELKEIRMFSKEEFNVSMISLVGVLAIGVLNGILIAILLSFIYLIKKTSYPSEHELVYDVKTNGVYELKKETRPLLRDEIFFYRWDASMLFLNCDYFKKKLLERISGRTKLRLIILDASPVNYLDITFRNELADIIKQLKQKNIEFFFVNADELFKNKLCARLQKEKSDIGIFFPDFDSAVKKYEGSLLSNV